MTKFKHKNGGIAEVFTEVNINRLRADKNYREIQENKSDKVLKKSAEEVEEEKPLQ